MTPTQAMIRPVVRGVYQIQKLRIAIGLRIVSAWKVKNGQVQSTTEIELNKEALDLLQKIREEYTRITDSIAKDLPSKSQFNRMSGMELIDNYAELVLIHSYFELELNEKNHFKRLKASLEGIPIYDNYLSKIAGVGTAMAGIIISEIDIAKATYVSSIWKYLGLDVVESDNRGRGRHEEHLVPKTYINRKGEEVHTRGLSHNGWAKSKLVYVLGGSFIRVGNERYRKIYDDYKHRLVNHPKHKDKTDGHRHSMARRYMVKQFFADLYVVWRELEGCEVHPPFHESKLGMVHLKKVV